MGNRGAHCRLGQACSLALEPGVDALHADGDGNGIPQLEPSPTERTARDGALNAIDVPAFGAFPPRERGGLDAAKRCAHQHKG